MSNILLAGPWVGELGWELFCWQGHVRKISAVFDKVIVMCKKGHEFLYSDFTDHFVTFEVPHYLSANMWMCDGIDINQLADSVREKYTQKMLPYNIGFAIDPATGTIASVPKSDYEKQRFIKYKSNTIDKHFDIIIHPRNKSTGSDRNWNQHNWQSLVDELKSKYSIAAIGNNESFELSGVSNFRNVSIADTVALMNRSWLVVGQSSGPLHLAALSGAKHLVWSASQNKSRFEKYWNPLNTACVFYGDKSYNPSVDDIYDRIIDTMKKRSIWSKVYERLNKKISN